jgi:hypothetical protein
MAISGGIYFEPEELVLTVDEAGLTIVVALLRQTAASRSLEIAPMSKDSGARPLARIEVAQTSSDLPRVSAHGEAGNICGTASALAGLADRFAEFGECNDINSPGMHTHIVPASGPGSDPGILHPDSLPIFLAGPVRESGPF